MKTKQHLVFRVMALVLALMLLFGTMTVFAVESIEGIGEEETVETTNPEDPTEPVGTEPAEAPTEEPEEDEDAIAPVGGNDPEGQNEETDDEVVQSLADGYYLIRPEWTADDIDAAEKFTENPSNPGEYMLITDFAQGDKIKVVHVQDGVIDNWYPSGTGNEYTCKNSDAGNRAIYFSPNTKNEWNAFGGYIYIAAQEDDKPEIPETEPDTTAPTLEIVDYYRGSSKMDSADVWVKSSETITVKVRATDNNGGAGINSKSFQIKYGNAFKNVTATKESGGVYSIVLSKQDKVNDKAATIRVFDNSNNVSNTVSTTALKIDTAAPVKEDVVSGVFSTGTDLMGSILNVLTFGLYDNRDTYFTVTVDPKGDSPIKEIKLKIEKTDKDGNKTTSEVTGEYENPKLDNNGYYYQSFKLESAETGYSYKLLISKITDEAGYSTSGDINILELPLYANDSRVAENEEIFEIVATKLGPGATAQFSGSSVNVTVGESQIKVYKGVIDLDIEVSDELSGLLLSDTPDGPVLDTITIETSDPGLVLSDVEITPTQYGSLGGLTGKLLKASVTATIPENTPSGIYTILVTATNNAGVSTHSESITNSIPFTVYINNTDPTITDVVVGENENTWTPNRIDVSFKVTEATPAVGVKSVNVIANYEDDPENPVNVTGSVSFNSEDGKYHFSAEKNGTFTITGADNFNRTSASAEALVTRFDNTPPVITITGYSNDNESGDQEWSAAPVVVNFEIDDTVYGSGIDRDTLSITAANQTEATTVKNITVSDPVDGVYTCSFKASSQTAYTIAVKDNAELSAEAKTTEEIKYDNVAPHIEKVVFENVTSVRSYGVYYKQALKGKVYVKTEGVNGDGAPLTSITIANNTQSGTAVDFTPNIKKDNGTGLYYQEFTLPIDSTKPYALAFSAQEENALSDTVVNLKHSKKNDSDPDEFISVFVGSDEIAGILRNVVFEAVATELGPNTYDFSVSGMDTATSVSGEVFYKGAAGTLTVKLNDGLAGLDVSTIAVTLNHKAKNIDDTETITEDIKVGNKSLAEIDDSAAKITDLELKYSIDKFLKANSNELKSGLYTLTVTAKNLAGNENEDKSFSFKVDNTAPYIKSIDLNDKNGQKVVAPSADALYGYFFKDSCNVTVHAADDADGFSGIGVKEIRLVVEPYNAASYEMTSTADVEDYMFTIPADFKGRLYAYAKDRLDLRSVDSAPTDNAADPRGLIVESASKHASSSSAEIAVDTLNFVGKDNHGKDLYRGAVTATFTVEDTYSGIDRIEYSVTDKNGTVNYSADTAMYTPAAEGWTVLSSDRNLATKLEKVIVLDPSAADRYNCNDIKITLTAYDNCGYEILAEEKEFSIDITAPIVKVEYAPATPTNTYNGQNYYNETRVATITVIERNFDPADFDTSKLVALEGTVPGLAGSENWSTSYTDYTDSSTHIATVTFDTDGKFEVDFDFTDMAKNPADKQFTPDTFYIDKTAPVLRVELSSAATPYNRYYNKTVTANIHITEHNFAADGEYLTYAPTATGPDNTSSATAPQISSWSSNGDEHTATITFSADGKYSFKIGFKDLATNAADDHEEETFYVDQTIEKPVITRVQNDTAYDGEIAPMIEFTDYNFDNNNYSYTLTKYAYDLTEMKQNTEQVQYAASDEAKQFGRIVNYQNFPVEELTEGVYVLEARFTDLAKNESGPAIVTFSVNRFGSVFVLGTNETEQLVENTYTKDAPDVVIKEINVNEVKDQTVSVTHNSANTPLVKGSDYDIQATGGNKRWYEYEYRLFSSNFEDEGEYSVTVSSVDEFNNTITNRTANTESETERNCPVTFVVDKTAPIVSITGVDENGYYSEATKTLNIICTDDNINKESLVITLDGKAIDLNNSNAIVDDSLVGEIDVEYPIDADGSQTTHSVKVEVKDYAQNDSSNAINAFTLSATLLTMFFHNTVALIISGAVILGLIAFGVIRFMKKRETA